MSFIKMVDTYLLQEVQSGIIIEVSKDVIDWLDVHDVQIDGDDVKYYIVNNTKYRLI